MKKHIISPARIGWRSEQTYCGLNANILTDYRPFDAEVYYLKRHKGNPLLCKTCSKYYNKKNA